MKRNRKNSIEKKPLLSSQQEIVDDMPDYSKVRAFNTVVDMYSLGEFFKPLRIETKDLNEGYDLPVPPNSPVKRY